MFVDTDLLRSGAGESRRAGEYADQAAARLSRGSLPAHMFGDFAAAAGFHEAAQSAHSHHLGVLSGHRETLASVGNRAHLAAAEFGSMDEHNALRVREVRCCSAS